MAGSSGVDIGFAVASALVAAYSVSRLIAARRAGNSAGVTTELTHVVMAAGMAAMFVPSVNPFPNAVWIGLFVLNGAWLIAALPRAAGPGGVFAKGERHRLHSVVSTVAMIYMFAMMGAPAAVTPAVAMPASGGVVLAHDHGAGGGGPDLTPLTVAFAVYFLLHAVWSARPVVGMSVRMPEGAVVTAPRLWTGPRLAGASHVVMGLSMSYMFAMMVG